jgi:asparagine synthase (glutamine-hydrolysing)
MFAFAFYDKAEQNILLARDRFGIKPLSIYLDDSVFLFASEIKAMKPWVRLQSNPLSIISYLMGFPCPTKNATFYKRVKIIPPGSVIKIKAGEKPLFDKFTELSNLIDPNLATELGNLGRKQVIDRIDELLQRSVKQMLFADAPVGALCSGGVDSSVLMAMASRQHSNLAIFHANVAGPFSEYEAALQLSKYLKLDLKTVDVHDHDFINFIPEVMYYYEHTFMHHPNSIPFFMVCELVRKHNVKAVLTGEGADECFLGYQGIAQEPFRDFCSKQVIRIKTLFQMLPKARGILKLLNLNQDNTPLLITGMLNHFERELEEDIFRLEYRVKTGAMPDRNIRTLDLLSYHLRTLLHRNDCHGMASSIESRFPFLDEKLVKTAINLSYNNKIRFSPFVWEKSHPLIRDKWVLRKVADRYIPKVLSQRKKQGFSSPHLSRIQISASFFKNSYIDDFLELTENELDYLLKHAGQRLKVKLLLLDVWGQVCLNGKNWKEIAEKMRESTFFKK